MAATEQVNVNVTDNGTADVVAARVAKVGQQADKSVGSVEGLNRALGLLAGAFAIGKIVTAVDTFNNMSNRLEALARRGQDTTKVFNDLYDVAQKTRAPFDATVNTFIRLDTATRTLGISTDKTIKIVETLNKGLILGGASASETSAVLTQFAQGIGSGKFGGDELKSFAENATYMADKVAKAILGPSGTVSALRDMGKQGKLTSQVIAEAMLKVSKDVDAQFAKMTPTIGQSMTVLSNAFGKFIYDTDKTSGSASALSRIILALANNMPQVAAGLMTIAAAYGTYRIAALAASAAQAIFNGAVSINPYVAVITVIAAVVAWLYTYGAQIQIGAEKTQTLAAATSVAMGVVWKAFTDAATTVWGWAVAVEQATVKVAGYIGDVYTAVTTKFSTLWTWLTSGFDNMWKDITKLWEGVKNYIASWVDWAMDKLTKVVTVAKVAAALSAAGQMVPGGATAQSLAPMDNLQKFANGGTFDVGGSGGTDSQTVAFNATPGETVTISAPTNGFAGASGTNIKVVNYVDQGFSEPMVKSSITKPINDLGGTFTEISGRSDAVYQDASGQNIQAINQGADQTAHGLISINGKIYDVYNGTIYAANAAKATTSAVGTTNSSLGTANGTLNSINSGIETFGNALSSGFNGLQGAIQSMGSKSALDGATMNTNAFTGTGMFTITPHDGSDLGNYNNMMKKLPQAFISTIDWGKVPTISEAGDPGSTVRAITAISHQYSDWLVHNLPSTSSKSLGGGSPTTSSPVSNSNFALAGFATGGSFQVGGVGGTDSQTVMFRASPDETVTISTPDQAGGGTTIGSMTLVFPGITDGDSLRRNRKQIVAGLKAELSRVKS